MITVNSPVYSLEDEHNYNLTLLYSSSDIFKVYSEVLNCYIDQYIKSKFTNTIYIKNHTFYYYLLDKGISTLNHVFKLLLIYTKNLELVNYYSMKTIYYYIEFIGQNNEHDENQIDYNNAALFSYTKTIHKINKAYQKTRYNVAEQNMHLLLANEARETVIFKNVEKMLLLYQIILNLYVHKYTTLDCEEPTVDDKHKLLPYIETNMAVYLQLLMNLNEPSLATVSEEGCGYKLNFILDFINSFSVKGSASIIFLYNALKYVQQTTPFIVDKAMLIKKILSDDSKRKMAATTAENYMNWLLQ